MTRSGRGTAAGHGERFDDRLRALAGAAHGGGAGHFAAQQVKAVQPVPPFNFCFVAELVRLDDDSIGRHFAADVEQSC
jgi:hypothetical protein